MSSDQLNIAKSAIQSGDKPQAMRILARIVGAEPKNEAAWFWLGHCVDEIDRKEYCFHRVLAINPQHVQAQQALAELVSPHTQVEQLTQTDQPTLQPMHPMEASSEDLSRLQEQAIVIPSQQSNSLPVITNETPQVISSQKQNHGCGCLWAVVVLGVVCIISWFLVQPGVFVIQPIGAIPDGVTFIYHSRSSKMPFFASPDGLCLMTQHSVSLLCRGAAIAASKDLTDRIILRLPYNHSAYLLSTGGCTDVLDCQAPKKSWGVSEESKTLPIPCANRTAA